MKCKFCGSNVPGGEIRCEVCGFTHVNFTDGDSSGALEKMIEKYKKSKLGDISIDLISHRYVIENGEFKDYHTESVKIADAVELVPDKIVWLKKSFYGSESDKTIVVEVCVGKNEKTYYDFSFNIKKTDDLNIGVKMVNGLKARIAVGNEESYVLSEEFDIC